MSTPADHTPAGQDLSATSHSSQSSRTARLIGLLLLSGTLLLVLGSSTAPSIFLDIPSLLFVTGSTCGLLLLVFGSDAFGLILGCLTQASPSRRKLARCMQALYLGASFAIGFGFLGTLIGMVLMLASLSDPSQIGPSTAMAILSQLYGVVFAIAMIALAAYLGIRHGGTADASGPLRRALVHVSAASGIGLAGVLICILIVCQSLS